MARKRTTTRRKAAPTSATLWAYDVGFGDCLLLELAYSKRDTRFVLFDAGSVAQGHVGTANKLTALQRIANDITDKVTQAPGGKLVAIVATHRHKDHISGFATNAKKTGPGDVLKKLKPKVVVQPWTETPRAAPDWKGPGKRVGPKGARALDAYATTPGTLDAVQELAAHAYAISTTRWRGGKRAGEALAAKADNNMKNAEAVAMLRSPSRGTKHDYVYAGARAKNLERELPGVTVRVIGPPTATQYPPVWASFADSSDEYWKLREQLTDERGIWRRAVQGAGRAVASRSRRGASPLFPGARLLGRVPQSARWLVDRMDREHDNGLLGMVDLADSVLNNSSVILLLKISNHRLLFPGDAQLENWQYALQHAPDKAATLRELKNTDLYKVGHHGSRNATPEHLLWDRFAKAGRKKGKKMIAVLSTKRTARWPGVPRPSLVNALHAGTELTRTDEKKKYEKGALAIRVAVF